MGDEQSFRYGPRLSPEEYDRRLSELHRRVLDEPDPSAGPADLERRVRTVELDLAIDRRLGVDFPREARVQLHQSRERVEARRANLTQRLLRNEVTRTEFATGLQEIVDDVVRELSAVLTPDEAKALLGVSDLGRVTLALDPDRIGAGRR